MVEIIYICHALYNKYVTDEERILYPVDYVRCHNGGVV